ncbi:cupin domain-containing protein [Bradyrhizobium elkanii]|uniref:Cupin domain-containing protein n=1 Tax=Bradyrhizobium elkanii TaxID=29448 RepID=A0A4U6RBY3_BRAEL|nr:cupin domain-containing protein [Bradyrhizobium elkanii]
MSRHRSELGSAGSSVLRCWAVAAFGLLLLPSIASAQNFEIKSVAEKKINQLPAGPLFWRIENFPTVEGAQAAAGPTGLAAEVAGKAWLFTLGPKGESSPGGSEVTEIGPVPPITAPEYVLRINNASGPPGVKTPIHTHPGSETFYVITGQLSQRSPHGVSQVDAGKSMPGHGPGMPMEVSSSGTTDLNALVMFVVDATKPFSSAATMP